MNTQFIMPSSLLSSSHRAAASAQRVLPHASLASPRAVLVAPEGVHPTLWRADQLGRSREQALPSGFAALDAQLPGNGWPRRALSELLLSHPGVGELRLLAPALRQVAAAGRVVVLFDPPEALCTAGWAQLGIELAQLVVVQPRARLRGAARERLPQPDLLWALEQALRSGHVGAVLAWLPARLRTELMRRLQLAAQSHDGPAFVLRESTAAQRPSPAPLRLMLQPAGADLLAVRLLKRRGPALEQPLHLALPPVLPASALGRLSPPGEASAQPVHAPQAPQPSQAAFQRHAA
jgi:protein ImuA